MTEFFSDEETKFRMDACLKKMLGKPLTDAEREVIRDVNRIQGWDRDSGSDRNGENAEGG